MGYTFKSETVKSIMPTGVTNTDRVCRSEVSAYLSRIKPAASKKFARMGELLVHVRLLFDGSTSWDYETIRIEAKNLTDDINALGDLLNCNDKCEVKPTQAEGEK